MIRFFIDEAFKEYAKRGGRIKWDALATKVFPYAKKEFGYHTKLMRAARNGKKGLTAEQIKIICSSLDCSFEFLMTGKKSKTK